MKFTKVTMDGKNYLLNLETIQTISKKTATQYEVTLTSGQVYTIGSIAYRNIIDLIGVSLLSSSSL